MLVVGAAVTGGEGRRRGRVDEHVEILEVFEELVVFGSVVAAGHSPALQLLYARRSPAAHEDGKKTTLAEHNEVDEEAVGCQWLPLVIAAAGHSPAEHK